MLVRPLSRTDKHIEDEHVSYVQFLHFLLTDAPFMDKARHTFDTPSVAPSSIGVVHRKGQLSGIFFLSATCHSLIGYQSCRSASSR